MIRVIDHKGVEMSDEEFAYYNQLVNEFTYGTYNGKDQFHNICLELFQEIDKNCKQNNIIQVVMPTHLYLEVNIKIRKKKSI